MEEINRTEYLRFEKKLQEQWSYFENDIPDIESIGKWDYF